MIVCPKCLSTNINYVTRQYAIHKASMDEDGNIIIDETIEVISDLKCEDKFECDTCYVSFTVPDVVSFNLKRKNRNS